MEGDRRLAAKRQAVDLFDRRDKLVGAIGIDRFGLLSGEPEDHRLIRRMAAASPCQRPIKIDAHARGHGQEAPASARDRTKDVRRLHRPDRMRRGRPDADLEQFENADHAANPFARRRARAGAGDFGADESEPLSSGATVRSARRRRAADRFAPADIRARRDPNGRHRPPRHTCFAGIPAARRRANRRRARRHRAE